MESKSLLELKRNSIKDTPTSSLDVVTQMEQEWPKMTKEFKRLQREQYELFCRKQHDYGPGNISVGTQLLTDDEIKLSLTGLWFRVNDKVQRIKNLLQVCNSHDQTTLL